MSRVIALCALTVIVVVAFAVENALAGAVCPAGQRPVQSEKEIYSNGCGVPGLHIQMDGSEFFERPCCDLHDACYGTCGADRDQCEKAFERCMDKHCGKAGSKSQQCK